MTAHNAKALADSLRRFAGSSFLRAMIQHVANNADAIATDLQQAILADVPQYSASRNPELRPESARHSAQHAAEILRLLRGGEPGDFEFVREHARLRAGQHFPLEAILHAYRSCHKVLSRWLRETPLAGPSSTKYLQHNIAAAADFAMEYIDAISTICASTYSSHAQLLADVAGDQRAELLQVLLDGHDEADPRAARILHEAGFPNKRQVYCVALARSVDPAEMLNAARARRLADSIEQILAESAIRRLVDIHANSVTMVFSDVRRESGWTPPGRSLARRMSEALQFVGNAVLIGVSNDVLSTAHIPTAHREAAAALEFAGVTERVVQFSEIPVQRLLLHFAGEDFRRVLPGWAGEFHAEDKRAHGSLADTIRAYAAADMNVLQAAQSLGVHPNTIYARFQRIHDVSGLQARFFKGLTTLLTVADSKRDAQQGIAETAGHKSI